LVTISAPHAGLRNFLGGAQCGALKVDPFPLDYERSPAHLVENSDYIFANESEEQ
jgi:hypothetical protein